jgi:hypothetical protein
VCWELSRVVTSRLAKHAAFDLISGSFRDVSSVPLLGLCQHFTLWLVDDRLIHQQVGRSRREVICIGGNVRRTRDNMSFQSLSMAKRFLPDLRCENQLRVCLFRDDCNGQKVGNKTCTTMYLLFVVLNCVKTSKGGFNLKTQSMKPDLLLSK